MYLLRLGLRSWRQAPLSQLFSAMAVGFLLFLMALLFWVQKGIRPILSQLEKEQVVTAYLAPNVLAHEESLIVDTIRMTLGSQGKLVRPGEFLEGLHSHYPALAQELEDLGPEKTQLIPRYISVTGAFSGAAIEKVRQIPGVEQVDHEKDRHQQVVGAFRTLRWLARALVAGIGFALITGLIQLARLNGQLHRDTLRLLRFWGASPLTLMTPSLISGLAVGALGGILAASGWMAFGPRFVIQMKALSPLLKPLPSLPLSIGIDLALAGSTIGMICAFLASLNAYSARSDQKEGSIAG